MRVRLSVVDFTTLMIAVRSEVKHPTVPLFPCMIAYEYKNLFTPAQKEEFVKTVSALIPCNMKRIIRVRWGLLLAYLDELNRCMVRYTDDKWHPAFEFEGKYYFVTYYESIPEKGVEFDKKKIIEIR